MTFFSLPVQASSFEACISPRSHVLVPLSRYVYDQLSQCSLVTFLSRADEKNWNVHTKDNTIWCDIRVSGNKTIGYRLRNKGVNCNIFK